jgi:hypothetical protein
MTRQTGAPLHHISLNPTYRSLSEVLRLVDDNMLTLDPPYQRGSVWTEDQRIALVQSWLRGLPAGVVILADRCTSAWSKAHGGKNPYDVEGEPLWACVDGKQRITTGLMWARGEVAVPASWFPAHYVAAPENTDDGPYVRYTGLTIVGQRFVDRYCSLLIAETRDCATVADEAAFYLLVNGGGTPQSTSDMANAARVALPATGPAAVDFNERCPGYLFHQDEDWGRCTGRESTCQCHCEACCGDTPDVWGAPAH